jgi:outer membrane lipoprotein-sorting protein
VPKKGTAGTVRAAEITVDLQKHEISEVKLEHRGGNRSEIKLSQISIGTELPDPLFHFIVPPNTDRMETE